MRAIDDEQSSSSSGSGDTYPPMRGGPTHILSSKGAASAQYSGHAMSENGGEFEVGAVGGKKLKEAMHLMGEGVTHGGGEELASSFRGQHPGGMSEAGLKTLEMVASVLEQYSPKEAQELFTLYSDPRQSGGSTPATLGIQGKLILTEAQFNLVKKVYPKVYANGQRFSLSDNQLILQFFMNLKSLYGVMAK